MRRCYGLRKLWMKPYSILLVPRTKKLDKKSTNLECQNVYRMLHSIHLLPESISWIYFRNIEIMNYFEDFISYENSKTCLKSINTVWWIEQISTKDRYHKINLHCKCLNKEWHSHFRFLRRQWTRVKLFSHQYFEGGKNLEKGNGHWKVWQIYILCFLFKNWLQWVWSCCIHIFTYIYIVQPERIDDIKS